MMTFQPDWAPGLHPLVVHFPIALLISAVVADACSMVFPRSVSPAAAARVLYPAGALSALAAYLTGRQAAATALLPGMAHPILLDHWNLALATTICFLAIAAIRLAVGWWGPSPRWVRPALMVAGFLGVALLFYTGDRGGRLVYEHGVGVRVPTTRR